ncbi:RNA 3'-terminal phosphate cyclase domain-containing protein [Pelagophyceae sp. CCMP2097]|nr:RNA 3'-terminal phosphate cyclase domain-containing protein [Pelagophyceae sp. CCMP2097]|mmetsp:Transcript_12207/g.42255  ORF Transcript_12207/g.42255 Transcript_12207/m.42255 type:complete len:383 (+) Transcript_12207:59-1207(+)
MSQDQSVVRLRGARAFRSRLVLATLCKRKVEVSKIRQNDEQPGLRNDEASFLRLLDKLTSGSRVEINATGTRLRYKPGFLVGGRVDHDVSQSTRGVGWFLDGILPLLPFLAKPLELVLTGATSGDSRARSADAIKHVALPVLRVCTGGSAIMDLVVERREAVPQRHKHAMPVAATEHGRVKLTCGRCNIQPLELEDAGLVKAVRGVAYCTRTSPSLANRVVAGASDLLRELVHEVRVVTDASARRDCAPVPGFGVVLVAETTAGRVRSAQLDIGDFRDRGADEEDVSPEDLGRKCAELLLRELASGGVVDAHDQPLLLTLMALGPEDASVARIGAVSKRTVERLRLIKKFAGVTFKLQHAPDQTVRCACLGAGFLNFSKAVS